MKNKDTDKIMARAYTIASVVCLILGVIVGWFANWILGLVWLALAVASFCFAFSIMKQRKKKLEENAESEDEPVAEETEAEEESSN